MATQVDLSPPIPSSNSLSDIVKWLSRGDIVELRDRFTTRSICYQVVSAKSPVRFISVDISAVPALMHESEWPFYIKEYSKAVEITRPTNMGPYKLYYFSLPSL